MRNALDDIDLSALFTPSTIGALTLRNRFAMAPMSRYAARHGIPAAELGAFYRRRAVGGVGLIISEGISVGDRATTNGSGIAAICDARAVDAWSSIVDAVHAEGVPIFAQLMHVGEVPDHGAVSCDIDRLIARYVRAARHARSAGFDGIEIHGAHGFLPHSPAAELVAAVHSELGPTVPVSYRFSQWKVDRYDARIAENPAELEAILRPIANAGVTVFHPSTRRFDDPEFPEIAGPSGQLSLAGWTRKLTGLPAIIVGSIGLSGSLQPLLRRFDRGEFDIAAVGRSALANPEFVELIRSGRVGDLVPYDDSKHKTTLD